MILDEVTCRFGLYNGSNGHGGGFSSGVLLGSSGFFWCSSGVPSLGYQESSGNEDLIDILTRIMLYLSKVFDIKNPSFK